MSNQQGQATAESRRGASVGSAVICDMLGCREHATGEVRVGDEYIPLCELHRQAEMERLMPRWRPLPPHTPNDQAHPTASESDGGAGGKESNGK